MDQMIRIMVFDHQGTYISDIDPTQVLDMTYVEEVNGEHSLTITTFQTLSKTDRLLIRDGMGVWREFVVLGTNESHTGLYVTNEYYCTWSLQYDLMATFVNNLTGCGYVPGHESVPKAATVAMGVALEGTDRWTVGTVTVPTLSSSSFYRRSGWEALQTVVEKWGGEVQATITVSTNGVVSRAVDLLTHVGTSEATRRFDYGHDITSIKRTVSDDVWPCRIVPLGKSMETENGGYTRRPDISSVNGGVMWLQNDAVVPYTRIPDGSGGWEYPTLIIMNESYEEPADVKAWGLENLADLTSPKVTYEANVAQFVRAGLDPHGVALGDNIVVVDRTFGSEGLRLTARVTKIAGNLLDASQTKLTIGNIGTSISRQLAGVSREVARLSGDVENASAYQATSEYMDALLGRINQEVNATGGYTYITQGEGIRTYDVPVSDPLVGDEASKVVEVKGGNIRIANSRTQAGDWDWKTVIQSGHIASELVTTAQLVAGYIGNATNGNFWNLDTGAFRLGNTATIGDRTVEQALQDIDANITSVDVQYAQNQSPTVAPTSGWSTTAPAYQAGYYIWQRTATTTPTGTSYSTPVMISGRDGQDGADGTSVTILGSYATYADLIADHPTGSVGDGYLVAGDLYVWDGTQWLDVGTIQGPQGPAGTNGADGADGSQIWTATAAPTTPNYTFALSSLTGPAGVSPQVGDIIVYSYYRYTISSVGTDSVRSGSRTSIRGAAGSNGTDGTNGINAYVHIAWANSADGSVDFSTTVSAGKQYLGTYADSTQADSQDYHDYSWSLIKGADGTDGSDGVGIESIVEQYYLSTSSSTQSGGSWSTNQPTWESGKYIWTRSFITWDDGTTATTTPTLAQAINSANQTASNALDTATEAAKVATNYLDFDSSTGLDIGYDGTNAKTRINGDGMEVYDGSGSSIITAKSVNGVAEVRTGALGKAHSVVNEDSFQMIADDGSCFMEVAEPNDATSGWYADFYTSDGNSSTKYYLTYPLSSADSLMVLVDGAWWYSVAIGGDSRGDYFIFRAVPIAGRAVTAVYETRRIPLKYYTMGIRRADSTAGAYSFADGFKNIASGANSHAEGFYTEASGDMAHAEGNMTVASGFGSHAEGGDTTASGGDAHAEGHQTTASALYTHAEGDGTTASDYGAHAEGYQTTASGRYSHAGGYSTIAAANYQTAIGMNNVQDSTDPSTSQYNDSKLFIIGRGQSTSNRRDALYVTQKGNLWIAGTLTQGSDRRLKEHHAYLSDDACEFVRKLRPALYSKDGERHLGFYAQDVQDADLWDTATVTAQHTDESLDYDPLTLDYTALIAPLTAYAQQLERRIEQLEARLAKEAR